MPLRTLADLHTLPASLSPLNQTSREVREVVQRVAVVRRGRRGPQARQEEKAAAEEDLQAAAAAAGGGAGEEEAPPNRCALGSGWHLCRLAGGCWVAAPCLSQAVALPSITNPHPTSFTPCSATSTGWPSAGWMRSSLPPCSRTWASRALGLAAPPAGTLGGGSAVCRGGGLCWRPCLGCICSSCSVCSMLTSSHREGLGAAPIRPTLRKAGAGGW